MMPNLQPRPRHHDEKLNDFLAASPQTPTVEDIRQWVAQAKTLPRVVEYGSSGVKATPDLEAIEGIGPIFFEKLSKLAGIRWQKELLERGKSAAGRKEIVEQTGINDQLILRWVNHCDLRRIKGINEQYAELLEQNEDFQQLGPCGEAIHLNAFFMVQP